MSAHSLPHAGSSLTGEGADRIAWTRRNPRMRRPRAVIGNKTSARRTSSRSHGLRLQNFAILCIVHGDQSRFFQRADEGGMIRAESVGLDFEFRQEDLVGRLD